jgi:riboflavin biosynthesis pyrimidine reductase
VSLTRLYPLGGMQPIDVDGEGARAALEELYRVPGRPWLRINLVASVNGSAGGADGTSTGLTNRTDRKILGAIRRLADVVLVGASSVRAEGYLLPRTAVLAVVTGTGDLTGHRMPPDVEHGRLLVICPPSAVDRVRSSLGSASADVFAVPAAGTIVSPDAIIGALHARGLSSIVCEGGPQLAAQLVTAGLADELCLTTSPLLGGALLPMLPGVARARRLRLSQLLVDEADALYARWAISAQQATAR